MAIVYFTICLDACGRYAICFWFQLRPKAWLEDVELDAYVLVGEVPRA